MGLLESFTYDDNGNLTTHTQGSTQWTFTYDFENRTTRLVKRVMAIPVTRDTLWFNYCGLGKRISKIEKPSGGSPDTTSYAFDGMYAVCEFGGHLDLEYKYVYANGLLLARYDASPADTHYYHHDGLGSIMGMTAENASVEQSYFYDEFGNSLGSWGSISNHYLYTGQEYDGSISALYNLRARYYDMRIGRFVQEDPILQSGNIFLLQDNDLCKWSIQPNYFKYYKFIPQFNNKYVYVTNNPINYSDILGLQSYEWIMCCTQIMVCIEAACRAYIPEGDPRKKAHDKQCEKEAQNWFSRCLLSEKAGGLQIPYQQCEHFPCWPYE